MNEDTQIIAVYDNGGETPDRYTVYINEDWNESGSLKECLAMSDNPTHPQGFSQFCSGELGRHNGKLIKFSELPEHIQEHTRSRLCIE